MWLFYFSFQKNINYYGDPTFESVVSEFFAKIAKFKI